MDNYKHIMASNSDDGKNKMSTKFGRKFNTDNDDNFVGGGSQQFQVR